MRLPNSEVSLTEQFLQHGRYVRDWSPPNRHLLPSRTEGVSTDADEGEPMPVAMAYTGVLNCNHEQRQHLERSSPFTAIANCCLRPHRMWRC